MTLDRTKCLVSILKERRSSAFFLTVICLLLIVNIFMNMDVVTSNVLNIKEIQMNISKAEIVRIFIDKGIISKNHPEKRVHCWKTRFDVQAQEIFSEFLKQYRTEDEAWFCLLKNVEPPMCSVCHKNLCKFVERKYNTVCECCSSNAVPEKIAKTKETVSKYSEEKRREIREKHNNTCLEKYGRTNVYCFGSPEFLENMASKHGDAHWCNREQIRETNLKNHNGKWNLQCKSHIEHSLAVKQDRYGDGCNLKKRQSTLTEKYGVKSYFQTKEFFDKTHQTLIETHGSIKEAYRLRKEKSEITKTVRYGDSFYHNVEQFKKTLEDKKNQFEIDNRCVRVPKLIVKYGQGWLSLKLERIYDEHGNAYIRNDIVPIIEKYASENHNLHATSATEQELYKELVRLYPDLTIVHNEKTILRNEFGNPIEMDIYIPSIKLGIEYNGMFWHSYPRRDITYHKNKTQFARDVGIHLLHVFEQDYLSNPSEIYGLIDKCINRTLTNIVGMTSDGLLIGDNSLPIFEDIDIVEITDPEEMIVETKYTDFHIYDCGKVIYKLKENKNEDINGNLQVS